MKFLISTVVVAFSLLTVGAAHAQQPLKMVTYDSLGADSLNTFGTLNPESAIGFANNSNAILKTPGDWIFAKFYHGALTAVDFQQGATIKIYARRDNNDTSHAWFILRNYFENWAANDGAGGDTVFAPQGGANPQVYTITVPHAGFNTVEVHMDTSQGAKPIFVDAIVLVQHGTLDSVGNIQSGVEAPLAEAGSFTCYPNPFIASQGATLRSLSNERATYIVMDLLGREIATVDASSNTRITVPGKGTYFVRKREGSDWSGAPLRIVAE